jgi:hypothetical protein
MEGSGASLLLDNFLSQLGGTISLTLRQLIVPPTPLFPASFAERVTFHMFLIYNHKVSVWMLLVTV